MEKWVDTKQYLMEYIEGDMVMVKFQPYQFKYLRKVYKGMVRKYEGPFPIIKRVGEAAYQVQLSSKLKVHPIFHVNLLKPYHKDKEDQNRNGSKCRPKARRL